MRREASSYSRFLTPLRWRSTAFFAAAKAFDRQTGEPVLPEQLKTYAEALAQYHLSSETKFENGESTDTGLTLRRHVVAQDVRLIGKEANGVGEFGEEEPGELPNFGRRDNPGRRR